MVHWKAERMKNKNENADWNNEYEQEW
jgi:hypothetical protein